MIDKIYIPRSLFYAEWGGWFRKQGKFLHIFQDQEGQIGVLQVRLTIKTHFLWYMAYYMYSTWLLKTRQTVAE